MIDEGGAMTDWSVAPELAAGLGEPAATALAELAEATGRVYELDRWLGNGRSRARVGMVWETDHRAGSSRRLVLKRTAAGNPAERLAEVARQGNAYAEAPGEFAKAHLARPVHEARRVGDGGFLSFAEIAGDDIEQVEVLTVLLDAMLDGTAEPGCDAGMFARACGAVVGGVLGEWARRPRIAQERFTVEGFLRAHVLNQMAPGGRLHALSVEYSRDEIDVPGEPGPLPSPFALARGTYSGDTPLIPALVGRCHGDLHSDNVLVRVSPVIDGTDFHLVDLTLYEPDGPVTRDPVHLLLYLLARRMDVLSAAQQSVLIGALLTPERADTRLLPGWLAEVIREVDGASLTWLKGTGLQPEWRRQRLLSLAGCAMLFLGRASTRREDLGWFLRLAARAAAAFLAATTAASMRPGTPGGPATLDATARIPLEDVP
jgi:hypothetical protein